MRLTSILLITGLVAAAYAQAPKAKTVGTPVKTQASPAPAKAAPAPAKTTAPTKTAAAKTAPAAKGPAPAAKAAVKTATAKPPAAKPAAKPASNTPEIARSSRRDPFLSPVRLAEDRMKSNPACTTGARCLVISQVVLKGTVKTQSGMIAMVENAAKKQYNLHEKDTVQNGLVVKITGDSIVFQETVTDPLGRPVTKEVVKRVTVPAV